MQTFLPYADFEKTAKCLDYRRLGKQRVEAMQIINTLLRRPILNGKKRRGWLKHPAVLMWANYVDALKLYYNEIVKEWIRRGYQNNLRFERIDIEIFELPEWLGNETFHASHRSNLLRKNSDYYSKFSWGLPDNLPYYWPVNKISSLK